MTGASQYTVPKEPGLGRALTLAALVHAALLAFLWIGVQWQSNTPATIEAEVWDPQPREAAPLPEPSPPKPVQTPEPEPVVKEPPKPKVVEPPPVIKPDIALEQEKKRKALEEKKRLEDLKLAKAKQEEEKRREAEKEKAEKEKKEIAEKKRKQDEADKKMIAKMREEDMRRLAGTGGSGDAPKAQGGRASAEYANRIGAKIKSNITFIVPESLQGNPPVEYEVRLLPDGSVAGMRKIRSSGLPGFDDAVARAIEKSQPFPRDTNGSVPSSFIGTHKPKD